MTMQVLTNMSAAFLNAKVKKGTGAAIINTCAKAIKNGVWYCDFGKGWNAHLSHKTHKELVEQGIM
jgi:hypothetical protein